jgi:transposase-like protein
MTDLSIDLVEYLDKLSMESDVDLLRDSLKMVVQLLMEADVSHQIGAKKYERTPERVTQRNGYRERGWDTRVGEVELDIPKLRQGSYYPEWLLEPRRPAEKALVNVVQEAYIAGVSTRKMEKVVGELGLSELDKSKVSRMTKALDEEVEAFRSRPLDKRCPYIWLDALYPKVRQNHRIVSQAFVIALGVDETGHRTILGFQAGAAETEAFWVEFLRSLVKRGLTGVQLVISDAHEGLKKAVGKVFTGASWQRCRVHFMRNVLAHVPKGDKKLVAAHIRTVFAQPDRDAASQQLENVVGELAPSWPKAADLLGQAEHDLLAHMSFPKAHWKRLASSNPLERLNREIRRRTKVVQIFPDEPSLIRLAGAILMETNDEWTVGRRYFSEKSMQALFEPAPLTADHRSPATQTEPADAKRGHGT